MDRCEGCGYALAGLEPAGRCPECGLSVAASSPAQRTGSAWQHGPRARSLLVTMAHTLLRPRRTFRTLRMGGSVTPDVMLLMAYAGMSSLVAGLWWQASAMRHGWLAAPVSFGMVVVLTGVEAMGVSFWAPRHGWAVTFRRALRVCCYAAAAWVPAWAVGSELVLNLWHGGFLHTHEGWLCRLVNRLTPPQRLMTTVLLGALVSLGFETLVWLGVRQIKYANEPCKSL